MGMVVHDPYPIWLGKYKLHLGCLRGACWSWHTKKRGRKILRPALAKGSTSKLVFWFFRCLYLKKKKFTFVSSASILTNAYFFWIKTKRINQKTNLLFFCQSRPQTQQNSAEFDSTRLHLYAEDSTGSIVKTRVKCEEIIRSKLWITA